MKREAVQWLGHNLRQVIEFTGWHPSASEKYTWEEYEELVREKGLKIFNKDGNEIVNIGDYICFLDGDLFVFRWKGSVMEIHAHSFNFNDNVPGCKHVVNSILVHDGTGSYFQKIR